MFKRNQRILAEKLVVVTGAAHGIGRATALRFARLGARLELFDLDIAALEETASLARGSGAAGVVARQVDVSSGPALEEAAGLVHATAEAVDVLVNNAGVGLVGTLLDTEIEDWDWLLGVNLWAVIHGVRAFAPAMLRRGHGQIVNVVSVAGFFAAAGLGAYSATKHAALGVSEALREELRPGGIGVTAVCPGIVSTTMPRRFRVRGTEEPNRVRARLERMSADRATPEHVADAIVRAVRDNPALILVGREALGLYLLKRFLPRLTPTVVASVARHRSARARAHDVG